MKIVDCSNFKLLDIDRNNIVTEVIDLDLDYVCKVSKKCSGKNCTKMMDIDTRTPISSELKETIIGNFI